jgi:hypothetical protein
LPVTLDEIRIRNPKVDDLGDVINDLTTLENQFLYDEKEIFLQYIDNTKTFNFFNELQPHNAFHILVREWNQDTWALGPIYEVKVDKSTHASKFSLFLSEKLFPHIDPDHLLCSKVSSNQIKSFKRGDLVLRRWSKLKSQSIWLG